MNFNKKHIITGVIATSVALPLCSSISEANGAEYRTITGNSVNLRKGPGTNHASIGKLNKGYKVEYLGNDGSWIKVKYDGKTGYVHGDYVGSSNNSNEHIKFNKVVTATSLNFRSGAGTKYSKIGSIKKGTEVGVISESNGWSKIKYSGKVGYVSSEYLASEGGSSNNSNETVKSYKIVDATSLNIRSGPGTNYSKIGSVKNKAEVGVISESNGWSKIKYSGKVGYVSSKYLINKGGSSSGGSNDSSESVKSYKIVDATSLNVRSGPGTNYSKIGSVKNNEEVGIISESNGWSKIKYSGKVGYVSSEYLVAKGSSSNDNSTSSDKADKVISLAKTLLGKKYSWGAEGPNAFDCSGYTYYVFKKSAGITIPRVSKDQSKHGKSVSRSNVVKGDLVFFDTEGSNNGQITHVGIYMGDGNFIHASSSKGKVVISDFNSSYYKKAFVNARRVL